MLSSSDCGGWLVTTFSLLPFHARFRPECFPSSSSWILTFLRTRECAIIVQPLVWADSYCLLWSFLWYFRASFFLLPTHTQRTGWLNWCTLIFLLSFLPLLSRLFRFLMKAIPWILISGFDSPLNSDPPFFPSSLSTGHDDVFFPGCICYTHTTSSQPYEIISPQRSINFTPLSCVSRSIS